MGVLALEGWREAWRPSSQMQLGAGRPSKELPGGAPKYYAYIVLCFCLCRVDALLFGLLEETAPWNVNFCLSCFILGFF